MMPKLDKVFWTKAEPQAAEGGYGIALDGRTLRTPARTPLVMPTEALAAAVAEEWQAQEERIQPETMPLTRAANAALDKLTLQFEDTVDVLAQYAETDLVCFPAAEPEPLATRQRDAWLPLIDWLRDSHGLHLVQTTGVLPVPQPAETSAAFRDWISQRGTFSLMGVHELITLSGSVVIARAVVEGALTPEAAWDVAHIDEAYQVEQWGEDAEARAALETKRMGFHSGARLLSLLGDMA